MVRADYWETVRTQPERLAVSAERVQAQLADIDASPWRDGTLGLVGMGASTHAGHLLVAAAGWQGIRAVNIDASLMSTGTLTHPADAFILTSESGESSETLQAAERIHSQPSLALTNVSDSPLTALTDRYVNLSCGVDSSVYTIGYTATLQAFALVSQWLGTRAEGNDVSGLSGQVTEVLESTESGGNEFGAEIAGVKSIDVVGHGIHYAAAGETALMLREAGRMPAAAHDTYQYLHGPMEWLDTTGACILFGSGRELPLAEYVAETGAKTLLITSSDEALGSRVKRIRIPKASAAATSVLEILFMQHAVGGLAQAQELRIEGFRYHQDDTKVMGAY